MSKSRSKTYSLSEPLDPVCDWTEDEQNILEQNQYKQVMENAYFIVYE